MAHTMICITMLMAAACLTTSRSPTIAHAAPHSRWLKQLPSPTPVPAPSPAPSPSRTPAPSPSPTPAPSPSPPPPSPTPALPVALATSMLSPPAPVSGTDPSPGSSGNYEFVGLGNIVAVHLVAIPGSNRFFFMERLSGRHPDGSHVIAGVYDMDTNNFTNVPNTDSLFCAGHTLMADGNIVVVGGHIAKGGYADGLKSIRIFDRFANTLITIAKMKYQRWYPTATLLPNGRVIIMGGTQLPGAGSQNNPNYELWDPAFPSITTEVALPKQFVKKTGNIYFPFNFVLPTGHLFSYCNQYGNVIDPNVEVSGANATVISIIPSHSSVAKTVLLEYPYSATAVMLPLLPENDYATEFVFFGGAYSYGWTMTPAVPTSLRLKMAWDEGRGNYTYEPWVLEQMGIARVMGDSVLLPNGHVIILNGAQVGVAGDSASGGSSKAQQPAMTAVMYNPKAPLGSRYTQLASTMIPRMYHSTAALTADGTVFVSGCDRCHGFQCDVPYSASPTGLPEYRVEIFYPPFYYNSDRPMLTFAQPNITYGGDVELGYDTFSGVGVSGVVLVAPSSTTHSFNTHQRVVGLEIVSDDRQGNLVVRGPPNTNIALPGHYLLFLLNGDSYSTASWVALA